MATASKSDSKEVVAVSTPKSGDNMPPFGLPMLDQVAPNRGTYSPKIADELSLRADAIKLLKELEGFSLKGDTSIYCQIMEHMAELCYRNTEGMGVKEGVAQEGDKPIAIKGISLSVVVNGELVPKEEAWVELKAAFLKEVEDASTETGIEFKDTLESPTLVSTLPKCYRAGILMAFGVAESRVFKKSPRPMLGTPAEPDGTAFNARKHVLAPAVPYNMLQPSIVYEAKGKTKKIITEENKERHFTYMSADNAALLHDKIFAKSLADSSVITDEKTGKLARRKVTREPDTDKDSPTRTEVHLGEGSKPEDVWQGMQAMTREMKTGEVEIPVETQQQAVQIVQEMVENLDKKGIEALSGSLVNLQDAIESQCEASGVAPNIFLQAVERLEDIPDIFKLSNEERLPLISIYKEVDKQIKAAA